MCRASFTQNTKPRTMDSTFNSTSGDSIGSDGSLSWMVHQVYFIITYLLDITYLSYLDLHYLRWLMWLFYPLAFIIALPIVILLGLYASSLFLHIYRLRKNIKEAYSLDIWEGARKTVSAFWDAHGRIWHGYEVIGMDKLPKDGPALIVYYHGAIPIDLYYFVARVILQKEFVIRAIGDRFLWKIPGWGIIMDAFGAIPGTVTKSVQALKDGHILAVAPGGVREAYFSDEFYTMIWNKRIGFAKIAQEAKVPVIPMFTQNCREAFRSVQWAKGFFRRLYERTRLPLVPIYGGFPVKMRTFIGDPIPYDSSATAEEFAEKVHAAVEELIEKYQKKPGNILRALMERFYTPSYCKL